MEGQKRLGRLGLPSQAEIREQVQRAIENERRKATIFPALVAEVLDENTVVINRGSVHGVKEGQRFLLYKLSGKQIIDPKTKEALGELEILKGIGMVTQVQDRIAKVESDNREPVMPETIGSAAKVILSGGVALKWRVLPFTDPAVGDLAKPV
jgi:hypothetical protein